MITQRIVDNDDARFSDHVLIVGEQDGQEVWRSWASETIDPAVRLSPDLPTAVDDRTSTKEGEVIYRVPTVEEYVALNQMRARDYGVAEADEPGADHHRVVATYAAVVDAVPVADAAAAVGLPEQALIDEALGWAAAQGEK